ncbi:CD225/dispanin family protein [Leeuwenhoekiella marinoflava]|uniref:Interferon-induced transmembrane protein n=2 Tax=Leeuwenhoekiella marinoflava TaxID=988 RepID=A0A4Q0PCC5_9FLAO|nr:CD225/dispanin family protein [Leeuwenhoekiella marinoflava]RXG24198.1 interferon-induced transmembrane protein [Leeuwenhoekiella marinoflava]SHF93834.1 Interferon-induced transmembrane protein [Leeuwenhoekiella marinoflava DSM 3653]
MENLNNQRPPKTWLVESILATVLCCLPFGIAGIVNAAKVESRFYAGDIEGAERASKEAKKWTIVSAVVALSFAFLYVILIVVGVASSQF